MLAYALDLGDTVEVLFADSSGRDEAISFIPVQCTWTKIKFFEDNQLVYQIELVGLFELQSGQFLAHRFHLSHELSVELDEDIKCTYVVAIFHCKTNMQQVYGISHFREW